MTQNELIKKLEEDFENSFKVVGSKDILLKVEHNDGEVKSESGILLELKNSAVEGRSNTGVVLQKGSEVTDSIKIGDTVMFEKYAGIDLIKTDEGEAKYMLIHQDKILGIVG